MSSSPAASLLAASAALKNIDEALRGGRAGRITAPVGLTASADASLDLLRQALGADDAAALVAPLAALGPHLDPDHRQLADRPGSLTRHTSRLREDTAVKRRSE